MKKAAKKSPKPRRKAPSKSMAKSMGRAPEIAFVFRGTVRIPRMTGKKARDLLELRKLIATASAECIFTHTYQYFSRGHILEYTNDFAEWVGESIEARVLAETLSNIDPYSFGNIEEIRAEVLRVIDYHLEHFPAPGPVMPGGEFYFIETVRFIFPVGVRARNLAEFLMALKYIDADSIYYHFYEARMRLGMGLDDFSTWIMDVVGSESLARRIRRIDPFMHDMEAIREHLVEILEQGLREEMEVLR